MSVEQGRPIGPDQLIETPVVEPDYIRQAMNVPLFERLLKQTTDVQAQLSYCVRRIEELLWSMPTRADIMDHENRKAAAREEGERQRRNPVGTEKIPQNESNYSPYGHQKDITAERGPKGRKTEEGKYDFEFSQYGHQEGNTAERGPKGCETEEGNDNLKNSPYGQEVIEEDNVGISRKSEEASKHYENSQKHSKSGNGAEGREKLQKEDNQKSYEKIQKDEALLVSGRKSEGMMGEPTGDPGNGTLTMGRMTGEKTLETWWQALSPTQPWCSRFPN